MLIPPRAPFVGNSHHQRVVMSPLSTDAREERGQLWQDELRSTAPDVPGEWLGPTDLRFTRT